jgi:hypothetical protein
MIEEATVTCIKWSGKMYKVNVQWPSGIKMVIFQTVLGSGYQMVRISDARDWTYLYGFQMVASLDHLLKKSHKKFLFTI